MPTVYGVTFSLYTRKLRAFLAEKGIAYRLDFVAPGDSSPEYRQISPLGKIPAYRDGEVTLADSSIICAYVERIHPEPALYPSEPYTYARALWFEEYGDSGLAAATGPIVFNKLIAPRFLGQPTDLDAVERATATLPSLFDYLESELQGEYLLGDLFTIGDVAVVSNFVHLRHVGISADHQRWPRLARYVERVSSRPSFQTLIEEELAMLGDR